MREQDIRKEGENLVAYEYAEPYGVPHTLFDDGPVSGLPGLAVIFDADDGKQGKQDNQRNLADKFNVHGSF
jgi:hypothetical protein